MWGAVAACGVGTQGLYVLCFLYVSLKLAKRKEKETVATIIPERSGSFLGPTLWGLQENKIKL